MLNPPMTRGWLRRLELFIVRYRTAFIVLLHAFVVAEAYALSFLIRLDFDPDREFAITVAKTLPLLVVVRVGSLAYFRLHQGLWRYVSTPDVIQIVKATTVGSLIFVPLIVLFFGIDFFPRSVFLIDWAANVFLLGGLRIVVRILRERRVPARGDPLAKRLLIVGAGDAGAALCRQALISTDFHFRPVAFIDEDPSTVGTSIFGIPVAGTSADIRRIATNYRADIAVIAAPTVTAAERRRLVEACQRAGIPVQILPSTPEILDGVVSFSRVRDVDPADLLGRPPARLDKAAIQAYLKGRRVLVTGAAGSVGSELVRQIAEFGPELLVLLDHAENPLMFLESEIQDAFPDMRLVGQICDVVNRNSVEKVMDRYRPEVVFHAAAHKHVPLMERAPAEAVSNNIGGTYSVVSSARKFGAEAFVMVSTDKAVNPISVMGASKRVAELLVHEMAGNGGTRIMSVRFGNVLGSNASVVPIFRRQIASGGPVTVTHPQMERFFMSMNEAAGLILQAGALGEGGETYILDMGDPIKIVSLAETLITLSGLAPYDDIDIVYTELRPGEKMSEELYSNREEIRSSRYEKISVITNPEPVSGIVARVEQLLDDLPRLDNLGVVAALKDLVPDYEPDGLLLAPSEPERTVG
jgi:FlaA1/EpsC-like NDP-sugar epimerase